MSGSSSTTTNTTTTGFKADEINTFLQQGNNQSVGTSKINTPGQTTRTDTSFEAGEVGLLGMKIGTGVDSSRSTGFLGEFSSITEDQVSALTNVFQLRQKEINQRSAAPGRAQLLSSGV